MPKSGANKYSSRRAVRASSSVYDHLKWMSCPAIELRIEDVVTYWVCGCRYFEK